MMIMRSVSNPSLFEVVDTRTGKTYYGCNQEWYPTYLQRRSGCGPSVTSNIVLYLSRTRRLAPGFQRDCGSKEKCVAVLTEMWSAVTPTWLGIPSTQVFADAVLSYLRAHNVDAQVKIFDVPDHKRPRVSIDEMVNFIGAALEQNIPVAFLNLCNGNEKTLSAWHWVTITAIEHEQDGSGAIATILDEGEFRTLNLALWYDTTTLGGGFVYFVAITRMME